MTVELRMDGQVALVTIRRPESLNSLNSATLEGLHTTVAELDASSEVRCVVISGEGERAFSVGSDLKETAAPSTPVEETLMSEPRSRAVSTLTERTPVIAAINGYCLGGGLELALACDIRVAGSAATFGLPELQIGSYPGGGGVQRLLAAVPKTVALEMLLAGERLSAERALAVGLVSRVVPTENLMNEAIALAQKVASSAPIPVAAVKRALTMGNDREVENAIRLEELLFSLVAYSEDRVEGRQAFREKRRPEFRGR